MSSMERAICVNVFGVPGSAFQPKGQSPPWTGMIANAVTTIAELMEAIARPCISIAFPARNRRTFNVQATVVTCAVQAHWRSPSRRQQQLVKIQIVRVVVFLRDIPEFQAVWLF